MRVLVLLLVFVGASNSAFGAYVISVYKNDGSGAKNTEFVSTGNGTQQKEGLSTKSTLNIIFTMESLYFATIFLFVFNKFMIVCPS